MKTPSTSTLNAFVQQHLDFVALDSGAHNRAEEGAQALRDGQGHRPEDHDRVCPGSGRPSLSVPSGDPEEGGITTEERTDPREDRGHPASPSGREAQTSNACSMRSRSSASS